MILDKVVMTAYLNEGEVSNMASFFSSTDGYKESFHNGIPKAEWTLSNLKCEIFGNRLKIIGSLNTFIFGESITDEESNGIFKASKKLSFDLGIDSQRLDLKSLELTKNIFMDNAPKDYFKFIGDYPRRFKATNQDSITFQQRRKTSSDSSKLIFYDKIAEIRKKGSAIPSQYRDKNILRIEVCIKKELSKQLGHTMSLAEASTDEGYNKLLNYLKMEIGKVKLVEQNIDYKWVSSSSDFYIAAIMELNTYGIFENFFNKIPDQTRSVESNIETKIRKAKKLLDEAAKTNQKDAELNELKEKIQKLQ